MREELFREEQARELDQNETPDTAEKPQVSIKNKRPKRIVLPEGEEPRTVEAAVICIETFFRRRISWNRPSCAVALPQSTSTSNWPNIRGQKDNLPLPENLPHQQ